jgi:periplasmic divalent cation tolerance protein
VSWRRSNCMSSISILYVTLPSEEVALMLARSVVEAGVAACTNLLPGMRSCYRWQEKIEESSEVVLFIKVPSSLVPAAMEWIAGRHPYQCPCIMELPVGLVHPSYAAWLKTSCGEPPATAS